MARARFLPALFLALVCTSVYSADPTPLTIDALLAKLATERKAKEDAAAAEAATVAAIKALLAADATKAAAAGITVDPPAPVDPLVAAVQAAYMADASTTKAADRASLAAVYRAVVDALPTIATTGELATTISSSTTSRIGTRLSGIRPLIGKDFAGHVPAGDVAMNADQKAEVAKTLTRYATLIEGLK